MNRWWCPGPPQNVKNSSESADSAKEKENDQILSNENNREWTFEVFETGSNPLFEKIALIGDCYSLGNWNPERAILMEKSSHNSNIWSIKVNIPNEKTVRYRYFVCSINAHTDNKHIRRWETHIKTRTVQEQGSGVSRDTFGDVDGKISIDRGWLTSETIIQFKFFNNSFSVIERVKSQLLYIKVEPINLRFHEQAGSSSERLSSDVRLDTLPTDAFVEVVSLKGTNCKMNNQNQFGIPYHSNDFLIFHVTLTEPENTAYLINFFAYNSEFCETEQPIHLGYQYVLPLLLKRSEGTLELPILSALKHNPIGMMTFEYLKIESLKGPKMTCETSYTRYWNEKWVGLEVGHRGCGNSFKSSNENIIRENTIASLKNAENHGADMVEFDVQLSKDFIPVLYHDFNVSASLKFKNTDDMDMFELPMREFTLKQLKNLKLYHTIEGKNRKAKFYDENIADHQPFPELSEALTKLSPYVGFNVEIKWDQKHQQLSEGQTYGQIDRNLYVDSILNIIFEFAKDRRIVLSCFDPDICAMLRFKQNVYPVMFLTQGVTTKWPSYSDSRCNTIERAAQTACAMEFLGIVAHSEDLLRDPSQIKQTTDQGLIIFCWGDDNNSKITISYMKEAGLHAIIYDQIDLLCSKTIKQSAFFKPSSNISENESQL